MQYILTEQEYNKLVKASNSRLTVDKTKLQKLCTYAANNMPVDWGWGGPDPKPWGCILSDPDEWYCDKCPVQDICPSDSKEYSK